jgi:hypothetical protein
MPDPGLDTRPSLTKFELGQQPLKLLYNNQSAPRWCYEHRTRR